MMLGHPGSGKSYFAKQLAPKIHAVRLNADHMRKSMFANPEDAKNRANNPIVFGAIDYSVGEILRARHNVIYDVQHNARTQRETSEKIATQFDAVAILVWIKTPYDVALKRGQAREETADQRKRNEEEMRKSLDFFINALEIPQPNEQCIIIDGVLSFDEQYQSFMEQLQKLHIEKPTQLLK